MNMIIRIRNKNKINLFQYSWKNVISQDFYYQILVTQFFTSEYLYCLIIIMNKEIIQVLKGFRNGLYYGGKVRLVHALVMTLLFKSLNKKQIINICKLGFEHAKNLGLFVLGYKATCLLLEKLNGKKSINNFIAGALFGGIVFGTKTPVNYQIVLYLVSRVLVGLVTLLYKNLMRQRWATSEAPPQRKYAYLVLASVCWGFVMWLFTIDKSTLQASLTSSMQFLYVDSNRELKDWRELVPFYVPKFGSQN